MGILWSGRRYLTLSREIPWFNRRFPSISFYARMIAIYLSSWYRSRRGTYTDIAWRKASAAVAQALEGVGARFEVEGLDVLERIEGPCVIVANHMSTLETFVFPSLVPLEKPVTYVVKETLLRYPVFGPVIASRDPVAVTRSDAREDLRRVMQGGADRLARGISVIVFPQTTRSRIFDPSRFNSIGAKLAGRAGVPVVPVALKTDAWGVGRLQKDFGKIRPERTVRFRFGEPIGPGMGSREVQERVTAFISDALSAWETARESPLK